MCDVPIGRLLQTRIPARSAGQLVADSYRKTDILRFAQRLRREMLNSRFRRNRADAVHRIRTA